MAILAGVAQSLSARPLDSGRVVLLFQPAEETGAGAQAVASDQRILGLSPHRIFALHNLPGYPLGQVLIRPGAFCAGSAGLTIQLKGRTSHAAYPEQGKSPDQALAEIVTGLTTLPIPLEKEGQLALVTVGHARLGQPAFGVTPGDAEILATLRSDQDEVLDRLKGMAMDLASTVAGRHGLGVTCTWSEEFPVTSNDPDAVSDIEAVACLLGKEIHSPDESPFRWSEDFGHLLQLAPGAMFGLGSGVAHPPLHAQDFDFPEELLKTGISMLDGLVRKITGK
jgi:amidohydrolase